MIEHPFCRIFSLFLWLGISDYAISAVATQPDSLTMHHGQKARIAVLANDAGPLTASTVQIVQVPQFGSASADSAGKVLYIHTTGAPGSDTFTYTVSGSGGTSLPTLVTINFSSVLRIANSALNVPAAPPSTSVQLSAAFAGVSFNQPVCMASPPNDTQRLFVCEKTGVLRVIPSVIAAAPSASVFLDLPALLTARGETISTSSEQGLLGLAFHPGYATNRFFFVFYSVTKSGSVYERVSRFTTQASNPNAADAASELILIEQVDRAGNHNGGDLHFGPDGYLYISFGDEGNQNDTFNNAQHIDLNFFSAIARIDVDVPARAGSIAPNPHAAVKTDTVSGAEVARFKVPKSNPFVPAANGGIFNGMFNGVAIADLSKVRTEFYAVGFRNPWRFSFDSQTGELWEGEVGQDTYEEVNVVAAGGNYGWSFREGNHNGPKSASAPANFDAAYHARPLYEYVHTGVAGGDSNFKGNSCTGGVVYRGSRFASLQGAYIFADYVSGNIWKLVRNGTNPPVVTRIAGEVGIAAFGTDPSNGDVLLADIDGNRILRLTTAMVTSTFPATLSETGLFADLTDLSPAPGLLPYTPNLPFWSDFAAKRRWFIIPDATGKMTWAKEGKWTLPDGMIWVKHFDMPASRSNPVNPNDPLTPATRVETRVLVKNAVGVYGVSYRWNAAQTEATLVPDEGVDFDLSVTQNGMPYTQRWHIPSRAECLACHNAPAGYALSFNTRQLNLASVINGFSGNQLDLLRLGGYFSNTLESTNLLPRHLRPAETSYSLEARARSYIAVNCAYCHQAGGTAPTAWDGRPELTLDETGLLNSAVNSAAGKLVAPGDTAHSLIFNRMSAASGFTRMPPIGSNELDQTDIALLSNWINQFLPTRRTYAEWRLAEFGSAISPQGAPGIDADGDGRTNRDEWLAGTRPADSASFLVPHIATAGQNVMLSLDVPANRSARVEVSSDLSNWSLWNIPGNDGIARPGGTVTFSGPKISGSQFFRLHLFEN